MRCQAELDAANVFILTCEKGDSTPPNFGGTGSMGQSSPSLEGGAADRQGETQFVVLGSELETDVGQPTGMRMGKKETWHCWDCERA